jgi:hypothetical protein
MKIMKGIAKKGKNFMAAMELVSKPLNQCFICSGDWNWYNRQSIAAMPPAKDLSMG